MNRDTLKALRGSIAKWKAIVKGTGHDEGPDNCPLCQVFREEGADCAGCPVAETTGKSGCDGSPYERWDEHHQAAHNAAGDWDKLHKGCVACKAHASAELAFLTALLPPNTKARRR